MDYVIMALVMFVGGMTQSITGMGYGMICMAALTLIFPYLPIMFAIKAQTFIFLFSVVLSPIRKKINWKLLGLPVLFSIVGNYFALGLIAAVDELFLKVFLGILLVCIAIFYLLNKKHFIVKPTFLTGAVVGSITGFLSGMSGVAGPPIALYYLSAEGVADDMESYYATSIVTFAAINAYQLVSLVLKGFVPPESGRYLLLGVLPTVGGIGLGRFFVKKIDKQLIRKAVYLVMLVMGVILVLTNI